MLDCGKIFAHEDKFKNELVKYNAASSNENLKLWYDFGYGLAVGIATLNPSSDHFVELKSNGCLLLWTYKNASLVSKINLNIQVNSLNLIYIYFFSK